MMKPFENYRSKIISHYTLYKYRYKYNICMYYNIIVIIVYLQFRYYFFRSNITQFPIALSFFNNLFMFRDRFIIDHLFGSLQLLFIILSSDLRILYSRRKRSVIVNPQFLCKLPVICTDVKRLIG